MTAKERVARHLLKHGRVCESDFDGTHHGYVADGGKPFHRTTARIDDLRKDGWRIRTDQLDGRALYVLVAEPGGVARPVDRELEDRFFDRTVTLPSAQERIAEWAEEEAA